MTYCAGPLRITTFPSKHAEGVTVCSVYAPPGVYELTAKEHQEAVEVCGIFGLVVVSIGEVDGNQRQRVVFARRKNGAAPTSYAEWPCQSIGQAQLIAVVGECEVLTDTDDGGPRRMTGMKISGGCDMVFVPADFNGMADRIQAAAISGFCLECIGILDGRHVFSYRQVAEPMGI